MRVAISDHQTDTTAYSVGRDLAKKLVFFFAGDRDKVAAIGRDLAGVARKEIGKEQVRLERFDELQRLVSVVRRSDHLEPGARLQQLDQSLTENRVIVGDDDADGRGGFSRRWHTRS